jgi:predicted Zn-dependent protease
MSVASRRLVILIAAALQLATQAARADNAVADYSGHLWSDGQFQYLLDPGKALWPNATVNWYYNPSGQPADLSTAQIVEQIQNAARKWENVCNVRFNYLGTTVARPNLDATFSTVDKIPVIGWGPLTGSRAGFRAYTSFWYSTSSRGAQMIDVDMVINTASSPPFTASSLGDLGALLTHETGHMLGIDHSDKQTSVMYANPYNSFAFQRTLRGDDVAACAALYGYAGQADANRLFNWAEQVYPSLFAPAGVGSVDGYGFQYRHYAGTGSYVGVQNGQIYYLPPGGSLLDLGPVSQFTSAATGAGF